MEESKQKSVYITMPKVFAKKVEYVDKQTGEKKSFNSVTLPKGTTFDGKDLSYYQFTPLFVNASKYMGENFVDIPLQPDREVYLRKDQIDESGKVVLDEQGKHVKDTLTLSPTKLKAAIDEGRKEYLEEQKNTVMLLFNKSFVHEQEYTDKETGETKTFSYIVMPSNTVVDGKDVGGYRMTSSYIQECGGGYVEVPVKTDKPVVLSTVARDENGKVIQKPDGKAEIAKVECAAVTLREGLNKSFEEYLQAKGEKTMERIEQEEKRKTPRLSKKAKEAKTASARQETKKLSEPSLEK